MAILLLFARSYRRSHNQTVAGSVFLLCFSSARSWKHYTIATFSTRSRRNRSGGFDPGSHGQEMHKSILENSPERGTTIWTRGMPTRHAQFRHKRARGPLSSINQSKSAWLAVQSQHDLPIELESLCEQGRLDCALDALFSMEQQGTIPSVSAYCFLLKACTKRKALPQAKQVYANLAKYGLESVRFLGESVVSTLAKCGGLEDALEVFHRLPHQTAFSWTALISGYTSAGKGKEALKMYYLMREEAVEPDKYTFASVVKACGIISDLEEGKRIHAEALRFGYGTDLFLGASLVDMYGKCGSILDAQRVFDKMPQRNVVSWNIILVAYTQQGQPEKVLQLYEKMQEEGVSPDDRTFVSTIQACGILGEQEDVVLRESTRQKYLRIGVAIHSVARRKGFDADVFVGSTLISMYAKCGKLVDSQKVFDGLSQRNVVSWNALLAAYAQHGQSRKVLSLYDQMQTEGVRPDDRTFVSTLQACGLLSEDEEDDAQHGSNRTNFLEKGKNLHGDVRKNGYIVDPFIISSVICMYGKCRSIVDARQAFDESSRHNLVTWNAMLAAYTQNGQANQAMLLYEEMQHHGLSPNGRTFSSVLQACGMHAEEEEGEGCGTVKVKPLEKGKVIHAETHRKGYETDVFVGSTLINLYGKCGSIEDAKNVFDRLPHRDVGAWNSVIIVYVGHGRAEDGLHLYEQMWKEGVCPDDRTFVSVLQACGMLAESEDAVEGRMSKLYSVQRAKSIHALIWGKGFLSDVLIASTLISVYAKSRSFVDAQNVFDRLSLYDVVLWNRILVAYVEQGQSKMALQQYTQMRSEGVSADDQTFVSLLQACGTLAEKEEHAIVDGQSIKWKSLQRGKALQAYALRKGYQTDVFIASTLIRMYGKCGSVVDAQSVFEALSMRSVVGWTAMLAAYVEQGQGDKVLQLYTQMYKEGISPDDVALVCILQACCSTGSLDICRQIHNSLLCPGNDLSLLVANTLIHAYGRCASMAEAQAVFDALAQPDVVSWTAMISGHARQGDFSASLQGYEQMEMAGVKPNEVTFLSLLSACSHAGLVDKGAQLFESMTRDHNLTPEAEHYAAMVDLLGRAGYFRQVEDLLSTMPMQPSLTIWMCLLGACQKHGNIAMAQHAFDCALRLQPMNASAYMLMFNIYSDAGLQDQAANVTELRQRAGAWKKPGQTWIEHSKEVRSFAVGDCKREDLQHLYRLLGEVSIELQDEAQNLHNTLSDVEERVREGLLISATQH